MKYYLFFILLILTHKIASATSNSIDSVLFSQNGQFVLIKDGDSINDCASEVWRFYQWDKEESQFYVTFFKDSVFFLTYSDTSKLKSLFPCGKSSIRIAKKISQSEYTIKYNFAPASHKVFQSITFKTDTIKSYYKSYTRSSKNRDSTKYYDIKILFYMADQLLFTDTISTNYPEMDFAKYSSNYTIYCSSDCKYYFIHGFYYYYLSDDEYSYSRTQVLTRKIRQSNQ